jgi:hypothetical protein
MDIETAEKMISKAQDIIRKNKIEDFVEVDELNKSADWQRDSFVEVTGGTYVKAWVFVPEIP